jgi:DNA modification methylase
VLKGVFSVVFEKRDPRNLVFAGYNPRKDLQPGDPEFERIKSSIKKYDYVDPVIINSDNTIIGGHQRVKVLIDLGYSEIDVVVVDLDKDNEKGLNLALNKITGSWDDEALARLLEELKDKELETGFDDEEVYKLLATLGDHTSKDEEFDLTEELSAVEIPKTKRGDVYRLGDHLLMCGDSTEAGDVSTLMSGQLASMVFTDPPWNVDYGSVPHNDSERSILNDNMSGEDFLIFLSHVFSNMANISQPGALVYVVMSSSEWARLMLVMEEAGFRWSTTIIWVKDSLILSRRDYHTRYEPIWYGWREGAARLCPLEDRTQSDVWEFDRPKRSDEHPTMKPVPLVAKAIMNSSHTDDVVVDLFGGSGTTLIACEEVGRSCRMMELDPKYCDVIVRRWEHATGKCAEIIQRGGEGGSEEAGAIDIGDHSGPRDAGEDQ